MPGQLEPVLPPPDLKGVPAQMSQIFAAAGASDTAVGPLRTAQVSALWPGRGGARSMTLLVAAVAGRAGLGAGALVIHTPSPAPAMQTRPAQAAAAVRVAVAAPEAIPTSPGPLAEPPLILPTLRQESSPPAAHHPPRPRLAATKAGRRREVEPVAMAQPASCEKNATGPGCRKAVIQADRHLRNVYTTAIRRGVPRGVLIDYRDRWADLRETDNNDPVHLIRGYGALAYDLGREAKDDQEGAARRRNPSGLRALASALAPWW